jgi:hypothetical protein
VPFPPKVITDCKTTLTTSQCGTARATAARRPLARIWNQIALAMDGKIETLAAQERLVWMPAHKSLAEISELRRSDGRRVTVIDWRANQLADALAKKAAPNDETVQRISKLFSTACEAAQYELALLGIVTHASNNWKTAVTMADGTTKTIIKRDAVGPSYPKRRANVETAPKRAAGSLGASREAVPRIDTELPADDGSPLSLRCRPAHVLARMQARQVAARKRAGAVAEATQAIVRSRAAEARPSSAPPAAQRLEELRLRIRLKAASMVPGRVAPLSDAQTAAVLTRMSG